jgi:beta-barrel assembly-enhancing protease
MTSTVDGAKQRGSLRRMATVMMALVAGQCFAQSRTPEFPNPGNPSVSREQQQQLGLQAAAEVYKQIPLLPDNSPEAQYVRQLGQQLAATIPAEYSWPFEFHVTAQKEINAFALPGGPMFVNIGTITAATSEAELVGVMGHEMAHVYLQHSAKQMQKAQLTEGLGDWRAPLSGQRAG